MRDELCGSEMDGLHYSLEARYQIWVFLKFVENCPRCKDAVFRTSDYPKTCALGDGVVPFWLEYEMDHIASRTMIAR